MAIIPSRTHPVYGGGTLPPGLFGHPGPLTGGTPQQVGVHQLPVLGRGIGGHPFYNLVAWHQSRAYRNRSGRPGSNGPPFQGRPPYNGGQPPRPLPPPRPPVFPVGPQPIGPQLPPQLPPQLGDNGGVPFQQPIYYMPGPLG